MRPEGTARRARATATAALACAALAIPTACDGGSAADGGDPSPGHGSSAAATAGSPGPFDAAHAVEPPGQRSGQWAPPDIIVTSGRSIPAARVAAIRRLRGVVDVAQISKVEIPVENRTVTVVAADPATYRNYVTDLRTAQTDKIWDRVAGGEIAIRPGLERRLRPDDRGFVALGSTKDTSRPHVGAYAEQTWQADAVVNPTWVEDLHMPEGNSLLIRTGGAAPGPLRRPIERLLRGTQSSVQMTDVVAREGLDPTVVQTAVVVGTIADAVGTYRYSVLGGGRIAPDAAWVASHITTETVPILGSVTCNKLMFPQLEAALRDVQAQGLADEIDLDDYAGCYYPRFIAGTTTLSNHAFGLALDLNVSGNQRGTVGEMDRGVVAIFERWGFTWGGRWHYTDPMHFEMNRLVRPG